MGGPAHCPLWDVGLVVVPGRAASSPVQHQPCSTCLGQESSDTGLQGAQARYMEVVTGLWEDL